MARRKSNRQNGYKGPKYGSNDFLEDISNLANSLREQIEADADMGNFDRSPKAVVERRKRVQHDFRYFQDTYFPHYGTADPSEFHLWIDETLPAAVDMEEGQRHSLAAPRGNAKSTKITQMFNLWCIITGRKRFPMILSDAIEVAAMLLEGIKVELEDNPRLTHDFPEHTGRGPVWQVGTIVTAKGVKIMVGGAGKRIRGARHGAQRPDIVFLDDIENDENVRSIEQRNKIEDWIDKVVEPLGPPDMSMDIFYVGTLLHFDSVLARKLKAPIWKAKKFKAIIKWPERMDLWDQWEELLRNLDDQEGIEADRFYKDNKEEMERGAQVLWPDVQSLLKLMTLRVRLGRKSFNSEYMNEPIDSENQIFQKIVYWVVPVSPVIYFGAVDPSLGKRGTSGDPSAIGVGAFDREKRRLDVVEASIRRRPPAVIIRDTIALHRQYNCAMWFIEAVQFQEFFRTQLMEKAIDAGLNLPARAVIPNSDKHLRIEGLQPPMEDGFIRLHSSQSTLITQFETFPQGHDDGPDMVEMLWNGALSFAPLSGGMSNGNTRTSLGAFNDDFSLSDDQSAVVLDDGGFGRVRGGHNWNGW